MSNERQKDYINTIREFPEVLSNLLDKLSETELTTIYLDGEWTVAQNVHHIADANFNKYNLIRQILTEAKPQLREFKEEAFADQTDYKRGKVELSLAIIGGLHGRAALLLESLNESDWQKAGVSPHHGILTVEEIVETLSTHGQRHIVQIMKTLEQQNK